MPERDAVSTSAYSSIGSTARYMSRPLTVPAVR